MTAPGEPLEAQTIHRVLRLVSGPYPATLSSDELNEAHAALGGLVSALAEARQEIEILRDRAVCSNCGRDHYGDGSASDCCSCDLAPASDLAALVSSARHDADEEHQAWNDAEDRAEKAEGALAEARARIAELEAPGLGDDRCGKMVLEGIVGGCALPLGHAGYCTMVLPTSVSEDVTGGGGEGSTATACEPAARVAPAATSPPELCSCNGLVLDDGYCERCGLPTSEEVSEPGAREDASAPLSRPSLPPSVDACLTAGEAGKQPGSLTFPELELRVALRCLADEAAMAFTEPRAFHESALAQHLLAKKVAAARQALAGVAVPEPPDETDLGGDKVARSGGKT